MRRKLPGLDGVVRSGTVTVHGSQMHYREAGAGLPVLLLHGNPTSSYLWRHLLRQAASGAGFGHRWIAPDLIGMGASGKPDIGYRLADHMAYVDGFIQALDLTDAVLVGHDWGVAIAIVRLLQHPETTRGLAFMEGHIRPLPEWASFDAGGQDLFRRLRTPGVGEQLALDQNFFLDTLLPNGLKRPLTTDELATYRGPFPDPSSRRPLLQWAREIPIAGDPPDVDLLMTEAATHLLAADVPTLLVHGTPGVLITADTVAWYRTRLRNLTVVDVGGPAGHFLPEDRPEQVSDAVIRWVAGLNQRPVAMRNP